MPEIRELDHNGGVSSSSNASANNLQEAMWRLKVQEEENNNKNNNDQGGGDGDESPYPDRPGAADCIYYLRMGVCGYGSNCRYNHPNYNVQANPDIGQLPERVGQPDCQYFLKTGTCKFGATCKYHHPRDRHNTRPVALNFLGLPLRQDEKSCPYYMRNGTCKFGIACKFNHPQPATMGPVFPAAGAPAYGPSGSPMVPSSNIPLINGLSTWPLARPPYIPSPRIQGLPAYMPFILPPSQGTMPVQQGWSTYMGTASHLPYTDVLEPTQTSSTKPYAQSGSSTAANLPERPNQPECQYYMKTGSCKYGTSCKYNHPKINSESSFTLGPFGLPLRPGHAVCTSYSMYGSCRFGSACKFDHPLVGYYNYAMPALPAPDPSVLFPPSQRSPPLVAWTAVADTPGRLMKSDKTNNSELNDSQNNSEQASNPPQAQTTSPSSHTAPSLESKIPQ
ncbi:zinc finger CCCH domain-containing protein 33-like isoform X1 [Iris pallida]|uniref:Zinc finger CCCH domain-containing protein 33-like isoform X1 n=1 Tax=Iris pallida TaxID=29817 RepID=A0AAX6EIZ4_IRIPA|nr:zinc finger CCCH domain-containing protein 33-like isoform X1 [Iris pallida]